MITRIQDHRCSYIQNSRHCIQHRQIVGIVLPTTNAVLRLCYLSLDVFFRSEVASFNNLTPSLRGARSARINCCRSIGKEQKCQRINQRSSQTGREITSSPILSLASIAVFRHINAYLRGKYGKEKIPDKAFSRYNPRRVKSR